MLEGTNAITAESIKTSLPDVVEGLSEFGFTSVIDMGIPFATEAAYQALINLDNKGELPLRVSVAHYVNTSAKATNGVETLENYAERFKSEHVWLDTLLSTTHSQMIHPDDRPRYKELNITMQTTGNWFVSWDSYIKLIGKQRYETLMYPVRTLADDGVNIAMGADWPATTGGFENGVHPFNNIYSAMHRKGPIDVQAALGTVDKVLLPANETLTLPEAVAAFTIGGAKMLGIDDQVGTIEVGKKADLILLDQNLFEIDPVDIPKTKVLATMFDGRIVHDVVYDLGDDELVDMEKFAISKERPF